MASDLSRAAELVWRGDNTSAVRALEGIYRTSAETTDGLKVDADEQTAAFAKVREETGALRDSMMGLAGLVGIGGVAFGLRDLKDSGVNLQRQQVQLQSVLRDTGQTAGDAAGKLEEYAEKLSTQGGFGTTENLQALTQYVGVTHSATQAQSMLALSTNIARQRGLDLTTVQQAVARAYAGSTRGLQQLLGPLVTSTAATVNLTTAHQRQIAALQDQAALMGKMGGIWLRQQEINDHITAQQADLAALDNKRATGMQVLAAAQREFGGATAAYMDTTAGKTSNLDNSIHNLVEQFGVALLPAINDVVTAGAQFATFLTHNKTEVLAATLAVAGLTTAWGGMKILKGVGGMLVDLGKMFGIVTVEGEASATELTIAWDTFMTATVVGLVLVGLVEMIEHWKQVEKVGVAVWHAIESAATFAWHMIETGAKDAFHFIEHDTPLGALLNIGHEGVGGALHALTFGALSGGGVVRPHYFDMGGPVGTDTIPGWLSPGEGVVTAQGMSSLGAGGLSAINSGQAPLSGTIRVQQPYVVKLDARVLTQSVIQQILNLGARGPSTLTGGSLVVGAPGLPV